MIKTPKRVNPWSQVTLPTSLRSLTFGHEFNQSLQNVNFPDDLQSMTKGRGPLEGSEKGICS